MTIEPRVQLHRSCSGIRIYQLPVETFPQHINNVYLILDGDRSTLFDVGSGTPQSVEDLRRGFAEVRARFGEAVDLSSIQHVVISHSHIDHFGFVAYFTRESDAEVLIHELDARVLNNFEERIVLASKDLRVFMERSGMKPGARQELEEMYRFSKHFFKSVELDRILSDGDRIINGYTVHHVPGHCPGQICLQVEDVLFTADHVLSRITPHQSPASITPFCGLEHYLQSLDKIRRVEGVALALPGHEEAISDLPARIDAIVTHHMRRLNQVLEICREPASLVHVSKQLFGAKSGYTRILALEEAGAHVEYLFQRGELRIANLEEVSRESNPVIYYETRRGADAPLPIPPPWGCAGEAGARDAERPLREEAP
ncbi:MAG: MBL fold metallo-hydrolase [Candidatus Rokubacteria bacterium]|nr:MBL fold metallo-hydrolase [Candidatus Rokubacteria bacterium]